MWQQTKNIYHLLQAFLAALFYFFPSRKLTVIGVTGTDGKTTTSHMIYQILKKAGFRVSMVSSMGAQIGLKKIDTGFHITTPSPWRLQKLLKDARDEGSNYFVLEVTSHGLDQNRLAFVKIKIAVVTNITHEHLDYHKTWQNYSLAKAKLFKNVEFSILNADDTSYKLLKSKANGRIIIYSLKKQADFSPENFKLRLKIAGNYNLANALAAAAVGTILGIRKTLISQALGKFQGVKGRMQEIDMGQDFQVFIDFAHTPYALEQALKYLRSARNNQRVAKIIAVFGAAGERDKTKRPLIGKIAAQYADVTVLTAEDPRGEKVEDICHEIAAGFIKEVKKQGEDYYFVYDRAKAIQFAVKMAQKGDIVATFGKSHEKSMCYGKHEYPWDEFAAVKKALRERLAYEKK